MGVDGGKKTGNVSGDGSEASLDAKGEWGGAIARGCVEVLGGVKGLLAATLASPSSHLPSAPPLWTKGWRAVAAISVSLACVSPPA